MKPPAPMSINSPLGRSPFLSARVAVSCAPMGNAVAKLNSPMPMTVRVFFNIGAPPELCPRAATAMPRLMVFWTSSSFMDDQSTFPTPTSDLVPSEPFHENELVSAPERTGEASPATLEPELASAILTSSPAPAAEAAQGATWQRVGAEVLSGVQTLFSAAVYATLIVTFCFQVARVDGLSMAPTLQDHDRLIVNKLVYELGEPRPGDIVMLYYPLNPEKMFVKRVIAKEGDTVRIVDGHVYLNDIPLHDDYVPEEFRSHDD